MDWTLAVIVLPVSDIDAAVAFHRELKVRGETPLIPIGHRGRFGA